MNPNNKIKKRYTKTERINDLITALNELRKSQGKPTVKRCWTGAGHWLKTEEEIYKTVGSIFTKDDEFIGFLQGLLCTDQELL